MGKSRRAQFRDGGSGRDSLAGYDYQMDVSVWVALQVLVANKQARELVLEPPSEEDIEGQLAVSEPGRIGERIRIENYTLVVQAKLRGGDAWNVASLKALLRYGGSRRQSAAERLREPDVRYLLVTSAALNVGTRGLRVTQPALWPKPGAMPSTIASALPPGADGRIAVLSNLEPSHLQSQIKSLLIESFRVPRARWKDCLKALRGEAFNRIKGVEEGRWQREDLERIIREHEGYLASTPELELFVKPKNWDELRSAMRSEHAALLIGQSGTGKTWATRMLYHELREEIPDLKHVPIRLGPQQLRDDTTAPPVLYDIEDPWGRFDFDPKSRPWNDQLDQFFTNATHDKMIIATTRRDVANEAGVMKVMRPWTVPLESEHYGDQERARIFELRIPALPWDLQAGVTKGQTTVLAALATPLEIQKFFDAVPTLDQKEFPRFKKLIKQAINQAHEDSIERTVIEQIEERKEIREAAVIWSLLKVSGKFLISRLQELQAELADRDGALDEGVLPLVRFFVAGRNLRQNEEIITYYHSRVESGIQQALQKHPIKAAKTLRLLIEVWLSSSEGDDSGARLAARLVAAASSLPEIRLRLDPSATQQLDAFLETLLAGSEGKFEDNLELAAAAGSKQSAAAELARYLLNRSDDSFGFDHWERPDHGEDWYIRLREHPATHSLLERFIREILSRTNSWFSREFPTDVKRLDAHLSSAFLDAARGLVHYGVFHSAEAIADGALDDLPAFEGLLEEAFQASTPTPEQMAETEQKDLAIRNGEFSDEYEEHLINDNEAGYTADVFIKAYVHRVRGTVGWQHLLCATHQERLRFYWLHALLEEAKPKRDDDAEDGASERSEPTVNIEELDGAFTASLHTADEDTLWYVVSLAWDARFLPALSGSLRASEAHRETRLAALTCAVENAPDLLEELSEQLLASGSKYQLLRMALDLAHLCHERAEDWIDHKSAALAAMSALPAPFAELGASYVELLDDKTVPKTEPITNLMDGLTEANEDMRRARLALGTQSTTAWVEDVNYLLSFASKPDVAIEGLLAAERAAMSDVLRAALHHKFAAVRAAALKAIGSPLDAPLPEYLLQMVSDRGRSVRRALLELLASKPHSLHMLTLLLLAGDKYSTGSQMFGGRANLPIARDAVVAIKELGDLSRVNAEALQAIAVSTDDPVLESAIFVLLAVQGGKGAQGDLLELAIQPGRASIRRSAAAALMASYRFLDPEVIDRITPDVLLTQSAAVAARLSLVLGERQQGEKIKEAAVKLAAKPKRRALIVLLARIGKRRKLGVAQQIEDLLPSNHSARQWVRTGIIDWEDDRQLSNLGDPQLSSEVWSFMKHKPTKKVS